ncbi:MAG: hypothetical protein PHU25_10270 [Deltaproteobacteria bacterium]|nr:hypothetical protein [Deltaproteobacteria bacterium]
MSRKALERVERLLDFRRKERDRAGAEVGLAMVRRERSADEARCAERVAEGEMSDVRGSMEGPVTREDLELALGCVLSAEEEAARKRDEEAAAENEVETTRKRLLDTHIKARQMELLLSTVTARLQRSDRLRGQREIDDLVTTRKVRR